MEEGAPSSMTQPTRPTGPLSSSGVPQQRDPSASMEALGLIMQLRGIIDERDRFYQQRFADSEKAMSTALVAAEKAVNAALIAAKEAVLKAETSTEKRFDSVNEFRSQLRDMIQTLMPRSECDVRFHALEEKTNALGRVISERFETLSRSSAERFDTINLRVGSLNELMSKGQGRTEGIGWIIATAVGGIGAMIAIVTLLLKIKSG